MPDADAEASDGAAQEPAHTPQVTEKSRVKNKAPAPIQITAEQLLREAWENKEVTGASVSAPRHQIADAEELAEYQQTTRKSFEDRIIMSRSSTSLWLRYARWEEAQRDFIRARSVFERAIDNNYRAHTVWLAYAEMEMRNKFVNHARNVWDRAVTYLPRVSQLWLKYSFMEEMLSNFSLARLVFSRWMQWKPDLSAYIAFVRFELRHGNTTQARSVFEQMVQAHPSTQAYLKFAAFEEKQANASDETSSRDVTRARAVFERVSPDLGFPIGPDFYIAFARFEERCGELDRARAIYKFAITQLDEADAEPVFEALTTFEKQRGEREAVEAVVVEKKRAEYEKCVADDPRDYDTWFDLIHLERAEGTPDTVRHVYERATKIVPVQPEKRYWRRFIYLFLEQALWEELEMNDPQRAADVYRACLDCIPNKHKRFSFAKVWVLAAKLEIRRKNIAPARRLFGMGLGVLPHKASIYREYIAVEIALNEVDRARTLYQKWIERNPRSSTAFIEFAEMEALLQEMPRARAIFELALSTEGIDSPEAVWRAYVACETDAGEHKRIVELYERLLEQGNHVNLWLAYAKYLQGVSEKLARDLFARADRVLKAIVIEHGKSSEAQRADRVLLLDTWVRWERGLAAESNATNEHVKDVEKRMPKRIKRRRQVTDKHGVDAGWEEYFEYVFPEEQETKPQFKILDAARKWKRTRSEAL